MRLGRWSESRSYAFVDQRVVEKVEMGQWAPRPDQLAPELWPVMLVYENCHGKGPAAQPLRR